ncbi:hypothetical protein N9590_04695 [Candidatus Pelagibacter sp.]|nr:hypothetical protein [Candidatus Pelagibacter sp.]
MSKLTNKKTIKNQVKNLIISVLVAGVLSLVIKQMPKQTASQFQGEIIFSSSLSIITKYLTSTNEELFINDISKNNFVRLILDSDKAINDCALNKVNGQYTIAGVDQKNKIIFSFLVNSEIDQQKCVSSLQKVLNEEAIRVLMTHRSILLRTNEIYDEFNKQRISEEQNKKKILEELKQNKSQLIPLLSVEKTFGRLDYSVNERVLNTLKIQLLSDTIKRKNLFLTTKVTLVSKKQSSTKEVFFIVMIAMFSIMNLKLFIKVIRKF